jgi:OOP family OmpA-OmpF porin
MQHRNFFATALALLSAAAALAGCSSFSSSPAMRGNWVVEPMNLPAAQQAKPGATFVESLAYEYSNLASNLSSKDHDWADADYFSRKGLAAGNGSVVVPEQNSNWLIPLEVPLKTRNELSESRNRLVAALDGGARDRNPALAAKAQARYDCWVERMEDDWKTAMTGPCRAEFLAAMDELERGVRVAPAAPAPAPVAPARLFNVYFDFDKATLTEDGRKIVDLVAGQAKGGNVTVTITGKADLSGTDAYNLGLSKRRAEAVRQALVGDGVPAGKVEERYVGMREPPVPTAAGVREPRNRVVEISFH